MEKLQQAIEGEPIDQIVPALAACLAAAGAESGVSRRVFIAYVTDMIDAAFIQKEKETK